MVSWLPTLSPCPPSPRRRGTSRSPALSTARPICVSLGAGTVPGDAGLCLVPCRHLGPLRAGGRTRRLAAASRRPRPRAARRRSPHRGGPPGRSPIDPRPPHQEQSDNYAVLRYGGDGPLTELVCGGLRLEHPSARRLLDGLPPVVHVRTVRRTVLGATLDLLAEEVRGREVGNEAVISRLCDIVVIQAIRHWMTDADATGSPWLRAMGDPQIGPALAALHGRTGRAVDGWGAGLEGGDVPLGIRRVISPAPRPTRDGLSDRAPHAARRRPPPPQ